MKKGILSAASSITAAILTVSGSTLAAPVLDMAFNGGFADTASNAQVEVVGNVTLTAGVSGEAASFNGGYLRIPADNLGISNEFSIAFYLGVASTNDNSAGLFELYTPNGSAFKIDLTAYCQRFYSTLRKSDGSTGIAVGGVDILDRDNWAHVAITYDGTNFLSVYVNGKLAETYSTSFSDASLPLLSSEQDSYLTVGSERDNGFIGDIDEFLLYNTVLSDSEIESLASLDKPDFDSGKPEYSTGKDTADNGGGGEDTTDPGSGATAPGDNPSGGDTQTNPGDTQTEPTVPGSTPANPDGTGNSSGSYTNAEVIESDYANVIELYIDNPNMTVNGVTSEIDPGRGTVPIIVADRTLVPIRAIIESMGGTIEYDGRYMQVNIRLKESSISLWIGSTDTIVNGMPMSLDVEPQLINDRTMLPIRFVTEQLGAGVKWDETNRIRIFYN